MCSKSAALAAAAVAYLWLPLAAVAADYQPLSAVQETTWAPFNSIVQTREYSFKKTTNGGGPRRGGGKWFQDLVDPQLMFKTNKYVYKIKYNVFDYNIHNVQLRLTPEEKNTICHKKPLLSAIN